MLMVLFSWALIGGAALLFGKAVTDIVYRNRFWEMGRPDGYIVTGLIAFTIYAQLFSLFYKVAGICDTILGMAGVFFFFWWGFLGFSAKKTAAPFSGGPMGGSF